MAFSYGFYNSLNHDRTYDAEDVSRLFDGLITDGIIGAIGDTFAVKESTGSSVTVGSGRAWFNHSWSYNDTQMVVDCGSAGVILDRYDAVILEMDCSSDVRANSIKVIHGDESSAPVKPKMKNDEFVNQYPLAYILRKAGLDSITQSSIENRVGTSECPLAIGVLKGMDADQLLAQWQKAYDEWIENQEGSFETWSKEQRIAFETWSKEQRIAFDEWFKNVRGQLSTDAAGHLQNQIDAIMQGDVRKEGFVGHCYSGFTHCQPT
jgi:hypothetical protein